MSSDILEFYIEKEKRELINTIGSAKYISEDQKEAMVGILKEKILPGVSTHQVLPKAADTTYHGPSKSAEIADKRRTLARMEKEYRDPSTPPSKKEQLQRTIGRIKDRIKEMQK